jgi:hypothetical protein
MIHYKILLEKIYNASDLDDFLNIIKINHPEFIEIQFDELHNKYLDSKIILNKSPNTLRVLGEHLCRYKDITNLKCIIVYHNMYQLCNIVKNKLIIPRSTLHINTEIISEIQQIIYDSSLLESDYELNLIYYNTLSSDAKLVYSIHKHRYNILTNIFRTRKFNEVKKYLRLTYNYDNDYENLINRPIGEHTHDGLILTETNIPFIKIYNILHNIFLYAPKLTKSIVVYRAEKEFKLRQKITHGTTYKFNGYVSTTNDPKIGFCFNKVINKLYNKKHKMIYSLDVLFKIIVPIGTKIVIPGINQNIDNELEILLNNESSINIVETYTNIMLQIIDFDNNIKPVNIKKFIIGILNETKQTIVQ